MPPSAGTAKTLKSYLRPVDESKTDLLSFSSSEVVMAKILVIGDDAVSRLVLEHMLVNMGLDVVTGGSVDEAVGALSQSLFDLIVCDYLMPERTGLDLLTEAAECPTPFVLVAGEADWYELGETPINGVAACLTKPVSNHDLVGVLNNLVRRDGARRPEFRPLAETSHNSRRS